MIRKLLIVLLFFTFDNNVFAQNKIDTAAIKNQLSAIRERDQKSRVSGDSSEFMP
jgi:hypothetical protein